MNYLLDSNVVSEWTRPRPDSGVVAFLTETDEDLLYLSVVTLAELYRGVERMRPGMRKARLAAWLEAELLPRFEGRILAIDPDIAFAWARVMVRGERRGRLPGVTDAWIAAIAEARDMTVVTRDTAGFEPLIEHVLNPWRED